MSDKVRKRIVQILIVLTGLAAIKTIFAGIERDETYAISMAYRMVQGDHMLEEMWESHQTSAWLMAIMIKIFLTVFGTTTGIVIYLRVFSLLIMAGVSYYLFCVMRDVTDEESAFCGALLFFNVAPKEYVLAEFSCMQVWFSTLLILLLIRGENSFGAGRRKYFVLAGIVMSCLVLAYPSCIIMFPCICIALWRTRKEGKEMLLFVGACIAMAMCFGGYLLSYMSATEVVQYINLLIGADATHATGDNGALYFMGYAVEQLKVILVLYGIVGLLVWGIVYCRKKRGTQITGGKKCTLSYVLLIGAVVHLLVLFWPTDSNWLSVNVHLVIIFVAGIIYGIQNRDLEVSWPVYLVGVFVLISTVAISNLSILDSMMYMISGVSCAMCLVTYEFKKSQASVGWKNEVSMYAILFVVIISRGYLLGQSSVLKTTVFDVAGIIKQGPAVGIVADYMTAYMFNSNYEEFRMYLQPGDKVMIANDTTIDYLDVPELTVCASSTISTPTYDENLLKYWEINPDKYPEVVVVDCWFGESRYPEGTWLGDWLVNEFCAEQIIDGKYFRYYINRKG